MSSGTRLIRNIGIIAHIDAGKTTTTEGILFFSGLTHRYGNIDEGSTTMDFLPEERARGITIRAAAATIPWKDHFIHLIDTPGHIDFTAEVERSLRVIDGAVVIFGGVEGVEAQSEKVWRQADHYHVPKIAFVNKLDRIGASFARVVEDINTTFGNCAVPVQEPIGVEDGFHAILDLVTSELITFSGDENREVHRGPVPAEHAAVFAARREHMIERLADHSEEIAVLYLDGADIPVDLLRREIRALTLRRMVVPVFLGSGKRRLGIQPLADGVIDYLPSPDEVDQVKAQDLRTADTVAIAPDPKAPFAGLIFKVNASASSDLFYVRTYAGTLHAGDTLLNSRSGERVRPKQLLRIYAKNTEMVEAVGPGDIVGLIGLRDCGIGDTLCDPRHRVAFESIAFPDPVISIAIEPKYSKDKDRLDEVLGLLCREDQTLSRSQDEDTGQRLLSGMGELHLEINLKRIADEFGLDTRTGEPRVAYRETFTAATSEHVVFSRVLGETEIFAEVRVAFKPLPRGEELFRVSNSLKQRNLVPKALIAAAEKALADGLRTGGNHGYPLIYAGAELTALEIQPDKTTEGAVVGAVLEAVDQAIAHVGTVVLEPLMRLEVMAPEDCVGDVSVYLQPRRAIIHAMASIGPVKRISCQVPLAEMFGFGKALPKLTGGRGAFSMEPCGYQELPAATARQLFGSL
ncbi:MAG: GTP-binding protein [Lentisphaerae bacterium]|nr:GTP-binding protein [Lentisphaerota bacterium]